MASSYGPAVIEKTANTSLPYTANAAPLQPGPLASNSVPAPRLPGAVTAAGSAASATSQAQSPPAQPLQPGLVVRKPTDTPVAQAPTSSSSSTAKPQISPLTSHDPEKPKLVKQIKELVSRSWDGQAKWASFCKIHGDGNTELNLYDVPFLQTFLEAHEAGRVPVASNTNAGSSNQSTASGKGSGRTQGPAESKIFVGGLPKSATEQSVAAYFSQFGPVQHVQLKYDGTIFKCCGFVTFSQPREAQWAIDNYNNNYLDGKWIDVKPFSSGTGSSQSSSYVSTAPAGGKGKKGSDTWNKGGHSPSGPGGKGYASSPGSKGYASNGASWNDGKGYAGADGWDSGRASNWNGGDASSGYASKGYSKSFAESKGIANGWGSEGGYGPARSSYSASHSSIYPQTYRGTEGEGFKGKHGGGKGR